MSQERSIRRQKRKHHRRIAGLIIGIIACALLILLVFGVILGKGLEPDRVEGLNADATYAEITLSWEPAAKASGYYIYATDQKTPQKIAEISGKDNCSYTIDEYTFDREYRFQVSAFGYNRLTHRSNEGESSEVVSAIYEPDQHAQKIPVLAYHKVVPADEQFNSSLLVSESVLEEQLTWLKDNGYTTLTMDEFYQWYQGKLEVPVKSCVYTFDDGFYGVYHLALPIFKRMDMAGTAFCIGKNTEGATAAFDPQEEKDHYIGYDVIEKSREEYPRFSFESHTYDMHNRVNGKKPALAFTYDQIMADCEANAKFGFRYLAYPWGAYSDTMQQAVKDSGYRLAFGYGPYKYATREDDPYAVSRIKISGKLDMDSFIRIVSGEDEAYDIGVD
ncbi:MAG: polysaccharide deacetylase family protein [Firmicutes bacterium]|nr:polysaccharide deacetylase family protein [Bacillota bacterium]